MATRKQKTQQQVVKQKETRNLQRRLNRQIAKLENELEQEIQFDIKEFMQDRGKPLTAKQIHSLRGDKLKKIINKQADVLLLPKDDGSQETVSLERYQTVISNVKKAQELAKKYDSTTEIRQPNQVMTKRGFTKFEEFSETAAEAKYWIMERARFIDNFMQSNSALGTDSYGYELIMRKISRLGKTTTVSILRGLVYSNESISVAYYFSSNQDMVISRLKDVFSAFGIKYDPNIDYTSPYNSKNSQSPEQDLTDDELDDLFD